MADYIYLLENRLSLAQRSGLRAVREVARSKGLTVFLVGGAVRDLTSGSPVRDLDVVVQGNALKLRKDLEKVEATITGDLEAGQTLFVRFPGNVRMEIGSTLSVTFPKPGKSVAKPATILEDLRRRDFTANAMGLSLNEGSYGLLMDPLNGVADIENRQLRLVSNYGFIEDPVRMIRAARLMARLGWTLEEKTQARYDTGKEEGYISNLSEYHRRYETEEIVHEEDPVRVLTRLEAEGWMKYLAPYWTSAKVNAAEIERLREAQAQLQMQGVQPDGAAAIFPLLTAKLTAPEVATLKAGFPRQGFVAEIEALEGEAKEFAGLLGGKAGTLPSQAWRMMTSARPEAVLWTAYSTKSPSLQAKFKSFATEWPQARQKMPYALMQEMRIAPELDGYNELLEKLFFELMDGKLTTPEEMKAFLEPYSPPAPPPPVNLRRARTAKKEAKPSKSRAKKAVEEEAEVPEDAEVADEETAHESESGTDAESEVEQELPAEPEPAAGHGAAHEPAHSEVSTKLEAQVVPRLPMRTAPLKAVIAAPAEAKPAPAKATPTQGSAPSVKEASAPAKEVAPTKKTATAPAKTAPVSEKKTTLAPVKQTAPAKKTAPAPVEAKKVAVPAVAVKKTVAATKAVVNKVSPVKGDAATKSVAAKKMPVAAKKTVPATRAAAKKALPVTVKTAAAKVPAKAPAKPTKAAAKKAVPAKAPAKAARKR